MNIRIRFDRFDRRGTNYLVLTFFIWLYFCFTAAWHPFNSRRITKGHPVKIRIILLGYCLCPAAGRTSGLL